MSAVTKRLFVGISFDSRLTSLIEDTLKKLKTFADKKDFDIKWTPLSNLHLTLKFLGDVDVDGIPSIEGTLSDIAAKLPPMRLKVRGLGGFPEEKQARVIWVGVQNKNTLQELHSLIEDSFVRLGFESTSQEYTPHVTIGRLRNKKNIQDLISPFVRKEFGKAELIKLQLFESHLQGQVPIYRSLSEFQLNGTSLCSE